MTLFSLYKLKNDEKKFLLRNNDHSDNDAARGQNLLSNMVLEEKSLATLVEMQMPQKNIC
jgi:hypothetical protein